MNLIEEAQKAKNNVDYYMRQGWDKDRKISDLEKEIEKLTTENKKLKAIFSKNISNEDSVSMFFSVE